MFVADKTYFSCDKIFFLNKYFCLFKATLLND